MVRTRRRLKKKSSRRRRGTRRRQKGGMGMAPPVEGRRGPPEQVRLRNDVQNLRRTVIDLRGEVDAIKNSLHDAALAALAGVLPIAEPIGAAPLVAA